MNKSLRHIDEGGGSNFFAFPSRGRLTEYNVNARGWGDNSSFISDATGYAIQHLQYLPFGEAFVDQQAGTFDSRYKFSAKEKDDETQYSYFGARYYDSDLSVWLSVDPMSDEYPHQSPFMYCSGNPVMRVDPNGMETEDWIEKNGEVFYDSRVRSQQDASAFYGEGAIWREPGYSYTANDGSKMMLGVFGSFYENGNLYLSPDNAGYAPFDISISHSEPQSGAIGSVSVIGTLVDVFAREPLQEICENIGMNEDAAYWTSVGLTAIGTIVLAKKMPGGKTVKNTVPEGNYANHLFKGVGKLPDNPANRALIQKISNGKPLVVDKYGKSWYRGVDAAGNGIYSYTQNGVIKGAGYTNFNTQELINHVINTVGVK